MSLRLFDVVIFFLKSVKFDVVFAVLMMLSKKNQIYRIQILGSLIDLHKMIAFIHIKSI